MEQMTAKQAIARSISHDEIVHCDMDAGQINELTDLADDWADVSDYHNGNPVIEFWGEDEDGNTWRVHVHE